SSINHGALCPSGYDNGLMGCKQSTVGISYGEFATGAAPGESLSQNIQ
ncbi:hypothetical protein ATR1_230d0001, partial [Acetobacter tropicalis]